MTNAEAIEILKKLLPEIPDSVEGGKLTAACLLGIEKLEIGVPGSSPAEKKWAALDYFYRTHHKCVPQAKRELWFFERNALRNPDTKNRLLSLREKHGVFGKHDPRRVSDRNAEVQRLHASGLGAVKIGRAVGISAPSVQEIIRSLKLKPHPTAKQLGTRRAVQMPDCRRLPPMAFLEMRGYTLDASERLPANGIVDEFNTDSKEFGFELLLGGDLAAHLGLTCDGTGDFVGIRHATASENAIRQGDEYQAEQLARWNEYAASESGITP